MKIKSLILLLSLMTLAACTNDSPAPDSSDDVSNSNASSEDVTDSSDTADSSSQAASSDDASDVVDEPEEPVAYEYTVNPNIFTIQPITDANTQVALLTFDDAPQDYSMEIAETVKEKGANAIFFVMGQFLEDPAAQDIIKEIYDMGFEIGNHSYSHPVMTDLTYDEQKEEIEKTNELVKEATGEYPRFFRAPHGMYDENTEAILSENNIVNMNWTYGYDWEEQYMNGPALADIMVNTEFLGSGANLLMHDRPWTAEAISDIIDGLRDKGFEIVDPILIESPESED